MKDYGGLHEHVTKSRWKLGGNEVKHKGVMYWKGGMKSSQEWKHLKSSSGNFAHSFCTSDLLLWVLTLLDYSNLQLGQQ